MAHLCRVLCMFLGASVGPSVSNTALIGAVTHWTRWQCNSLCTVRVNALDVLQWHSVFPHLFYKAFLSCIIGLMSSYVHKMEHFPVVGRFLFFLIQGFFFTVLSLNEGETKGYVKMTDEEIAVKRSLRFSFPPRLFLFSCIVLLAFSWHLDFQKTFY